MKVHHINEGYERVPGKRDFSKDLRVRFREIKVIGFRRLPTRVSRF